MSWKYYKDSIKIPVEKAKQSLLIRALLASGSSKDTNSIEILELPGYIFPNSSDYRSGRIVVKTGSIVDNPIGVEFDYKFDSVSLIVENLQIWGNLDFEYAVSAFKNLIYSILSDEYTVEDIQTETYNAEIKINVDSFSNKKPDWLSMQYDSFNRFFSREDPAPEFSFHRVLERHSHFRLDDQHVISIVDWSLNDPSREANECIHANATYSQELRLTFSIEGPIAGEKPYQFSKSMVHLPRPTEDSEFILASQNQKTANRYTMTMQLVRAPGFYYSEKQVGEDTVERKCEIIPVHGNRMWLKDNEEFKSFRTRGLHIHLEEFQKLLSEEEFADFDHGLLCSVYNYLSQQGLIPTDRKIPAIFEATIYDLAFVRELFRKLVTSLDFSSLGKKQIAGQLGSEIDQSITNLSVSEFQEIVSHFLSGNIPETDDRSLKNRKVMLVGDFLYMRFNQAIGNLFSQTKECWEFWYADKAAKARSTSTSIKADVGLHAVMPYQPLQWLADSLFRADNNTLMQLLDDTNPVSEISQKRRLTFRGPGGFPDNALFLDKRDVHPTDFGRLCPVETPQGEDLGFNLYLAQDTRISPLGLIETRFTDLKTNEELFLDPYDEEAMVRAAGVGDVSSDNDMHYARTSTEEIGLFSSSDISHVHPTPRGFLGYAASLIPFIQHNDANRALMGAGMMKQALPLLKLERPFVTSGLEARIAEQYGHPTPFIKDQTLCLGRNLLAGYMPWDLLNYEDGIVISDRLVKEDLLTHAEMEEIIFDELWFKNTEHFEEITRDNPHAKQADLEKLDDYGVIKAGSKVEPGTMLVSRIRMEREKEDDYFQNVATRIMLAIGTKTFEADTKDASLYAPAEFYGIVRDVKWEYRRGWEDRLWEEAPDARPNGAFAANYELPPGVLRRIRILFEKIHPIQVGDKLTGRHGNKGVISKILPEREMPYFRSDQRKCTDDRCKVDGNHTHLEILLNPLTITGRMNLGQLYETTLGWIAKSQYKSFTVPPFSTEWSWEKIKNELESSGLSDKQTLYFMEDSKEVEINQPVTVGYQYFLKLKHLAENKLKTRNEFVYSPITGQPLVPSMRDAWKRKAVNRKTAQRLGEMEVWALEGHSAWNILDEFLFLKSDDEKLRKRVVDFITGLDAGRKRAFDQFKEKTKEKTGWTIQSTAAGLTIECPQEEEKELIEITRKVCLKIQKESGGQYSLTYAPFDFTQREHRAFKVFIHYCRALGMEIEGIGKDGDPVKLVGTDNPAWPEITGIFIRLSPDKERKKWGDGNTITKVGNQDAGLWSNSIFGNMTKNNDRRWTHDATAVIELAIPVDNPLFRPVLKQLLNTEGFVLEEIQNKFQQVILDMFPQTQTDWEEFWQQAYKERSPLQTMDDLLDWLQSLSDAPNQIPRQELSEKLEECLPKNRMFNFQDLLNPESFHYLDYLNHKMDARKLYRHFDVMDTEKFKECLKNISGKKIKGQLELISLMMENNYDSTIFFIKNLLVLPKNLRFERKHRRWSHIANKDLPYESDLNIHYARIVRQNEKIKNFRTTDAPEIMVIKEENQLRDLVYGLLVNDRIKEVLPEPLCKTGGGKILKSILSHVTGSKSGKEGIFRKHLLGKRVNFSGRGVIVPDPKLRIDEAGVPFEAGKILFRDLLINRILKLEEFSEIKHEKEGFRKVPLKLRLSLARAFLDDPDQQVRIKKWMEELAEEFYVLLNRAPSLHRLSILAFRPRFHDADNVIRLNPYVCAPFNADFDGDTMALHLPILPASRVEAARMLPSRVLRSAGHGNIVVNHKGDLALAGYLLTEDAQGVQVLQELADVNLSVFKKRMNAEDMYALFNEWYKQGSDKFQEGLEKLTPVFRKTLNRSGVSLGIADFILDRDVRKKVDAFEKEFHQEKASCSNSEEKRKLGQKFWANKTEEIGKEIEKTLSALLDTSPLKKIAGSKAAKVDLPQLSGMRGIMLRPGGNYVTYPVCSNIADGMSPLEYFISCHGSRHGLADKGLMTGPAGDLTNILVQAAQSEYIVEKDCGTEHGLYFSSFDDLSGGFIDIRKRLIGRCLAEDLPLEPLNDQEQFVRGSLISHDMAEKIHERLSKSGNKKWIKLRSPITCQGIESESLAWLKFVEKVAGLKLSAPVTWADLGDGHVLTKDDLLRLVRLGVPTINVHKENGQEKERVELPQVRGICQKCYGHDLATGEFPPVGFPAGVIAGQSIGEPGTQLTLRTFHTGGIAGQQISQGLTVARRAFQLGLIKEPVKSFLDGEARVCEKTPNGMYWLEVSGKDLAGKERQQRLTVVGLDPVAGWTREMEQALNEKKRISFTASQHHDGSQLFAPEGFNDACKTVKINEKFKVTQGQRLYLSNVAGDTQDVYVKKICEKFGPLAAAEYLLHVLQRIYNANSEVVDHHFELILRTMMQSLRVIGREGGLLKKGEQIPISRYLAIDENKRPNVSLKTVLGVALSTPGFLSRLAFREIRSNLMWAAVRKETDRLRGLKEQIMSGTIRNRK